MSNPGQKARVTSNPADMTDVTVEGITEDNLVNIFTRGSIGPKS